VAAILQRVEKGHRDIFSKSGENISQIFEFEKWNILNGLIIYSQSIFLS